MWVISLAMLRLGTIEFSMKAEMEVVKSARVPHETGRVVCIRCRGRCRCADAVGKQAVAVETPSYDEDLWGVADSSVPPAGYPQDIPWPQTMRNCRKNAV